MLPCPGLAILMFYKASFERGESSSQALIRYRWDSTLSACGSTSHGLVVCAACPGLPSLWLYKASLPGGASYVAGSHSLGLVSTGSIRCRLVVCAACPGLPSLWLHKDSLPGGASYVAGSHTPRLVSGTSLRLAECLWFACLLLRVRAARINKSPGGWEHRLQRGIVFYTCYYESIASCQLLILSSSVSAKKSCLEGVMANHLRTFSRTMSSSPKSQTRYGPNALLPFGSSEYVLVECFPSASLRNTRDLIALNMSVFT